MNPHQLKNTILDFKRRTLVIFEGNKSKNNIQQNQFVELRIFFNNENRRFFLGVVLPVITVIGYS